MNKNKKYILALAFVLVSSIMGISAYAATDTANPTDGGGNFQRGMMRGGPNGPQGLGQGLRNHGPRIIGTITKIDGTTITVDSIPFGKNIPNTNTTSQSNDATTTKPTPKTYTVDATGATIYKDGVESKISNIAVNDKVMVEGTITDTSIKATNIYDGRMGMRNDGPNGGQGNWNKANGQNPNTQSQKVGFFGKIGNFFKNIFSKKN